MKKTVMIAAFAAMFSLAACSSNDAPEQTEKQQDSVDTVKEMENGADVEAQMRESDRQDSIKKAHEADSIAKLKK